MTRRYRVILERNELGGYTVTVPALPGCVTQGKDRREALKRAKEAILCHLEGLLADGLLPAFKVTQPFRVDISRLKP